MGGGNAKDAAPHALANVPLKWMLKEIIASDTGLIFRRSALERAHIDLDELVEAAERTKIEDAKHKLKISEDAAATLVASTSGNDATLRVTTMDGEDIETVHDEDGGKTVEQKLKEEDHSTLYGRWKTTSGLSDSLCKITDELVIAPAWWLLEFLPFIDSNQDEHGQWKNTLRYVFVVLALQFLFCFADGPADFYASFLHPRYNARQCEPFPTSQHPPPSSALEPQLAVEPIQARRFNH